MHGQNHIKFAKRETRRSESRKIYEW